ncbi:hypothetical protein ACFE04_013532 [Oxalis oulophora]
MQGGSGRGGGGRGRGRNPFPDPFGGFPSGSNSMMIPSLFGQGRDPFDDPFFTRPFAMFDSNFFGPSAFPFPGMHPFGTTTPFPGMHPTGFIDQQQPHHPSEATRRGPIIEELNSDDEQEEKSDNVQKKGNNRKHGRSSKQPYVQDPDEEEVEQVSSLTVEVAFLAERRSKQLHLQFMNNASRVHEMQPRQHQGHSFTFHSSSVTYGGSNGAYYTSSNTKRTGSDGLTFEESKEADSATGQASHRISRALHKKGHSLERKLNSDGRVDSKQTLHNLNEDELGGFEEAWNGKAQKQLPGWNGNFGGHNMGINSIEHNAGQTGGGWALPSTEQTDQAGRVMADTSRAHHHSRRPKGSVVMRETSSDYSQGN